MTGMSATVFGTRAHVLFAQKVRAFDLPGIGQTGVEQSWLDRKPAIYGTPESIRTDIFLQDRFGHPIAIYDLKTGNAQLTPARIRELREAVGGGNIPVFELNWRDVMVLHR